MFTAEPTGHVRIRTDGELPVPSIVTHPQLGALFVRDGDVEPVQKRFQRDEPDVGLKTKT